MKTKILLLAAILFTIMSYSYSQINNYDMYGNGSPNQVLQVDKLDDGGVGGVQHLIMKPSVISEYNSFIGIGVSQPSEKLHVAGNILADGNIVGTNLQGNIIKTPSIIPTTYPSDINLSATLNNNRFLLLDNGNFALGDILINHVNNDSKFEIYTIEESKPAVSITSSATTYGKGLSIQCNSAVSVPIEIKDNNNTSVFRIMDEGNIDFTGYLKQNGTEIKPSKWIEQGNDIYFNSGNVGIGFEGPISSPNSKLHLYQMGGTTGPSLRLENYYGMPGSPNYCWDIENNLNEFAISYGAGTLGGSNPTMEKVMVIDYDKRIGFGTDTPSSKLTIVDEPASDEWLVDLYNNNNTAGQIVKGMRLNFKVSNATPDDELLAIGGDLNKSKFSTTYFTVKRGLVGINKSNPTTALDVNGDVSFSGDLIQDGNNTALWRLNVYNDPYWLWNNIGIGEYEPEAKLHVSTTATNNEKAAIFGNSNDRNMSFVPQLSSAGFNDISQDGDFGIFWNDGTGTGGKNGTAAMVIAPHADNTGGIRIDKDGEVEIPRLWSTEIIVDQNDPWYDYVFEDDYNLLSLTELEEYIKINNHLPDIPAAEQVKENGINVAEMNGLLLKKVEELTLYIIDLEKRIDHSQNK